MPFSGKYDMYLRILVKSISVLNLHSFDKLFMCYSRTIISILFSTHSNVYLLQRPAGIEYRKECLQLQTCVFVKYVLGGLIKYKQVSQSPVRFRFSNYKLLRLAQKCAQLFNTWILNMHVINFYPMTVFYVAKTFTKNVLLSK